MMRSRLLVMLGMLLLLVAVAYGQKPGAEREVEYVHLLKHKRVALVINQTSMVGDVTLLDMLLRKGVEVKKIFVPEHGFRGQADAGAHVAGGTDSATGLPVVSLYGAHKQPTEADLADVDVVVYDLQDVGVRFYTYISTLEYCMVACAQSHKQLMILDRPDPNGFYVDGPVLEQENRSFVGMQQVPVVYGMTPGEYALMLKGEGWAANTSDLALSVIKCGDYKHSDKYVLPVAPSPNLRTMAAVYAYPSLCLFEGSVVSVGRGTALPFQQYGCPELEGKYSYSFTPQSGPGAKTPPYEGKTCYGELVGTDAADVLLKTNNRLHLGWLMNAYTNYPDKDQDKFFTAFFTKLSGTTKLQQQIKKGDTEAAIRSSWQADITAFKQIRKKYLLYKDFE